MNVSAARTQDIRVLSLIAFAHGTSHFFHLVIPSLFPWLMADFGLSFTRAGTLTTLFFVVSGIGQALAGFLVDRYGAQRVLWTGLALFCLSALVLGLSHSYATLAVAALLAGAGNSVFHPADYTTLNRSVSQPMLGHAFSAHGLAGNVGWAAAPVFMTGIAAVAGWRAAAFAAAALPVVAIALLVFQRSHLVPRGAGPEATRSASAEPTLAFLRSGPVWMCFFFFLAFTAAFGALQNFAPSIFKNVYGLPLTAGASALTGYLLGGAAGISIGGFLAARYQAHERVVALLLVAAATFALVLASGSAPQWSVVPLMTAVGFCTGTSLPSRDLLVRKAAMERFGQRSFGRIYGFVYSGLDAGLSVAPILFGRLMDAGMFSAVLFGVAVFQGLAIVAALAAGQTRPAAAQATVVGP